MLESYRVLDLTNERGLLCGQILADLGADVIVVEPPGGSSARRIGPFANGGGPEAGAAREDSLFWWAFNRNKRGVTLDIETAEGQARLRDLAATSDFLIESFDLGYLDQLGLGYAALSAINPRLVMVSITPFGQAGPKAGWAATNLTVLAASGVLLLTGDEDRPPLHLPGEQAWLHAGAEAAAGALLAHLARERDGAGQHVDVSAQTAAMLATQSFLLQSAWDPSAEVSRISGGAKLGPLQVRFVYPCKDGHVTVTFLFGTVIGPFTRRLFECMYEEGIVDQATRDKDWLGYVLHLLSGAEPVSEMNRCTLAIEQFTLRHTKAELFELAMARGLLIVPVSTTEDVVTSPQLAARDYWTAIPHPEHPEPVRYPGPFAKFSRTPISYRRRAPLLGEHNAELLNGTAIDGGPRGARSGPRGTDERPLLPLDGVKVLDFTWVVVGPMAVRYLSDYGATVVHVETAGRPDALRSYQPFWQGQVGPERSGQYANAMAGKLGLSLNLALPEGRDLALKLAAWADVVIENYSPRAMAAWGLDYDTLQKVNPGLVMMSTCLNGQTGPHRSLAGFGTMGQNLAGFGALVGWPDRAPAGPFVAYTDYVAPKFIAAATLAALAHRRRTGEGQWIDLSQAEASMHLLGPALLNYTVNGRVSGRGGNVAAEYAPHGVYPCRPAAGVPEAWVAIACATEAQWQGLCRATGEAAWATDARFATFAARDAHRDALDAELARWTATRDAAQIEQAVQAAGVPVHRANSSLDVFADRQLLHRGHFIQAEYGDLGRVPVESSRMRFSRTPAATTSAVPTLGQHNDYVLRELLKLDDETIIELAASGALE